jgi:hypothetical protein
MHSGTHPECVCTRHKAVCKGRYMVCVGNTVQNERPEVKSQKTVVRGTAMGKWVTYIYIYKFLCLSYLYHLY